MSKVVKFGGSSLASAEQFKKVGNIIRADKDRKYVVPSAPGKRFSNDTKVTDMLYACYDLADQGKSFKAELDAIKARYQEIIDGLQLDLDLSEEFKTIEKNFKTKSGDNYAASRGEYLNGIIMANYLGYDFIDAATVIFFDENGEFDAAKTNEVLRARLAESKEAVVPGFYGSMPDGTVKTFSRGGSDITGSIVAKAAKADVYENWTDVSGFLIADPRIIDHPEAIETITYRELRELAYMGATVLHEDAIFPVRQEGIPINIRNTNAPEDNGTWIVGSTCQKSKYVITGIVKETEKEITLGEVAVGTNSFKLENTGEVFVEVFGGIGHIGISAGNCLILHDRLGRMAEHLGHVEIEGAYAIGLNEREVGIARCFTYDIHRSTFALCDTTHVFEVFFLNQEAHTFLALVGDDFLGGKRGVTDGKLRHVNLATAFFNKFREAVDVTS